MKTFDVYERGPEGLGRYLGEVEGDDPEDALDSAHILASGERHGPLCVIARLNRPRGTEAKS